MKEILETSFQILSKKSNSLWLTSRTWSPEHPVMLDAELSPQFSSFSTDKFQQFELRTAKFWVQIIGKRPQLAKWSADNIKAYKLALSYHNWINEFFSWLPRQFLPLEEKEQLNRSELERSRIKYIILVHFVVLVSKRPWLVSNGWQAIGAEKPHKDLAYIRVDTNAKPLWTSAITCLSPLSMKPRAKRRPKIIV